MQSKMMAYDRVVSDLNTARLRGTSFPIIHSLIEASIAANTDVSHPPTICAFACHPY